MTTNYRRRRGRETELAVAGYLRANGFPYAEPAGAFANGADITGTPGVDFEIKARRDLSLPAWLRQAAGHGNGLPALIVRPDGAGLATIDRWAAILTVDDLIKLLHQAGYGEAA